MNKLTDLTTIRSICREFNLHPSKGFGQNFLVNPSVCPKLCEEAQVDSHSQVLEIGPGIGTLTEELAKRAERVVAVELDKRLLPALNKTLTSYNNVQVLQGDFLKLDVTALLQEHFDRPALLCANLPYNITSPILMKLLEERPPLKTLTVMVQKEAAQRICATPGKRETGAISYAVHYYSKPRYCFSVKPGSFYPPPKVTSAVIQLEPVQNTPLAAASLEEKQLFSLIRNGFSQRRKTLLNSLSQHPDLSKAQLSEALLQLNLSPNIRPEAMTLENFLELRALLWP